MLKFFSQTPLLQQFFISVRRHVIAALLDCLLCRDGFMLICSMRFVAKPAVLICMRLIRCNRHAISSVCGVGTLCLRYIDTTSKTGKPGQKAVRLYHCCLQSIRLNVVIWP